MPGQSLFVGGPGASDLFLGTQDARLALSGLLATNSADPMDVRLGVLFSGNQALITGTAGLNVSVAALGFVSSKGGTNGVYVGNSPATATVAVPAAPALGSKRVDLLWVRQRDKGAVVNPDADTAAAFGVATGTATTGTPAKPSHNPTDYPDDAQEVGTITWDSTSVVATATNAAQCTLATTCQWTATRGNPVPVRDSVDRDATISAPYLGMQVLWIGSAGSGFMERHNGTTWVPLHTFREHMGAINQPATIVSGALAGPYAQTFPAGRFTQPPKIQFGVEGSRLVAYATSITTAGFNLYLRNVAASDSPSGAEVINWVATQRTPNITTG